MSIVEFDEGEFWEGMPWRLIIPYESDSMGDSPLCRHVVFLGEPVPQLRTDGSVYGHRRRFTLPKGIAECKNEAGHNGTGLCLECLDEARASVNS